jgi:5-formyltetrahydrofolate cyclo-ligase
MSDSIPNSKQALRLAVRARLAAMPAAQRSEASAQARALLAQQALWQQARSVLFFAPMPEELDIWPLLLDALAAGKTVALPCYELTARSYAAYRVRDPVKDVQEGSFGIREPKLSEGASPLTRLDLILVPGVAFDLRGRRLGRGKGFYDRMLATLQGARCGVGFDEQVVEEVPSEPHDARLDCLLTPTRWVEF